MTPLNSKSFVLGGIAIVAFVGVESPRIGPISFIVGLLSLLAGVAFAMQWWHKRHGDENDSESAVKSFVNTKRVLMAMMALGIVAYVGGSETMANFSAEATNTGSTATSGSLSLNDQVGSGTVCASYGSPTSSQDNVNPACLSAITLTNLAPGVAASGASAMGKITVTNSGSVDGRFLYLAAPSVNTTLKTGVVAGANPTATPLVTNTVNGTIRGGDTITLTYAGTNSQDCTVAGASNTVAAQGGISNSGATQSTIALASCVGGTYNFAYPANTRITDGNTQAVGHTECYDASKIGGLDFTETITANSASTAVPTDGLCSTLYLWVQEQGATGNECWFGIANSNGSCAAPISSLLSATTGGTNLQLGASTTNLTFTATTTGNVLNGDTIYVTQGTNTGSCTVQTGAAHDAYVNSSSIDVTGCSSTPANFTFTSGTAVVTDATALSVVNNDVLHSVKSFDTTYNIANGKISLYDVTGNGTTTAAQSPPPVQLASGQSRVFYVGAYLIPSSGNNQNSIQGVTAHFGMLFHLDQ
jgi:hypothetical protein